MSGKFSRKSMKARGATFKPSKGVTPSVKKYVNRKIKENDEVKYLYEAFGAVGCNINSVGALSLYSMTGGTDGEDNRVGNTIQPTSLQLRLTVYRGNTDATFRLIVFRWKPKEIASNVTLTQILEQTTYATDNYVNAPTKIKKADSSLFNILLDKRYVLDDAKQQNISVVHNVKVNSKKIYYDGPALADARANEIYWAVLSDTIPLNEPTVNIQTIARFTDA